MNPKEKLFLELVAFSNDHYRNKDHFVCVYGSYATGHYTEVSDMDMFIVAKDHTREEFERMRDFLIDLHVRHKLNLDDEVPYENKLMMSYDDIERAVSLQSFTKHEKGYRVPLVEKTKAFLASPEIKWRLALNAFTTPHECVSGNKEVYEAFRKRAEKSIIELATGLSPHDNPGKKEMMEILIRGEDGEEGEMYLGYKQERENVIKYLDEIIFRDHS